jgi:hypothetical protein
MKRPLPLLVMLLVSVFPLTVLGQILDPSLESNITARLNRLEAENESLRADVQWMRQNAVRAPGLQANPVIPVSEERGPLTTAANSVPPEGVEYYTLPQLREEMKKLVWTKGDFKIVPYGYLWGNMVYSTVRTFPGSYTLYVPSATLQGDNEFVVDARNTRLGFDVTGPRIPFFNCAPSGGKVEIDFQNSVLSTENKPTILLRHAYWEVKDEEFRILMGQTWDVISPLLPGMIMYSVGWDGGNIGYRRAQLRGERYLAFSDCSLLTLQGSVNQQVFEDTKGFVTGETPNWPILEMRSAITLGPRGANCRPVTFGVSGHIGEEQFDFTGAPAINDVRRRTWSLNADFRAPFSDHMGFQAEAFTGENLGAFLGGIGQGLDATTFNPIRSNGGWLELWYDWTPRFHSHFGYSIDDPNNNDISTTGERTYNAFYFGNFVYDLTKSFIVGLEVSSWRTLYLNQLPGDSVRTEFMMKYGF